MSSASGRPTISNDRRFSRLPVEIAVELTRVRMSAGDIASLRVHDIIPIGHAAEQPVTLSVRGRPFASGDLQMAQESLVVRIIDLITEAPEPRPAGEE
jgi:flagellar motor switch/type III secretory pathway protein FliN